MRRGVLGDLFPFTRAGDVGSLLRTRETICTQPEICRYHPTDASYTAWMLPRTEPADPAGGRQTAWWEYSHREQWAIKRCAERS